MRTQKARSKLLNRSPKCAPRSRVSLNKHGIRVSETRSVDLKSKRKVCTNPRKRISESKYLPFGLESFGEVFLCTLRLCEPSALPLCVLPEERERHRAALQHFRPAGFHLWKGVLVRGKQTSCTNLIKLLVFSFLFFWIWVKQTRKNLNKWSITSTIAGCDH